MKSRAKNLSIAFLYDDTLDSNDGVTQYVKRLGSWLSSQGHEVTYLVGESRTAHYRGGEVFSLSKNLKLLWGGNKLSIPLIPKLTNIRKLLKTKHFDVIHVQVPYSPFMSQLVINRAADQTALVGSVHVFTKGKLSLIGSKALKLVYGRSLKRFDMMLSVSTAAAEYAKDVFGLDTIISPNVVDVDTFHQVGKKVDKDTKRIVFLGRLVQRKGCMQLLEAFSLLHNKMPEARLIIAGDGPQRSELEKYVTHNDLDSCVEFVGYIEEKDKPQLLASAAVACFPSLYGESFGIVLIEAMSAGSGVVLGGDNPGYKTVLGEQPLLLINPTNTEEFAKRLEKLLDDSQLRKKLHLWQELEVKKYDINTVGPQLLDIYMQAIASRKKSSHN